LLVVAVVDLKPIADIMENPVLVEAEAQDQNQEELQEMVEMLLLIQVVELVVAQEVVQDQILVKQVVMAVKVL
jgi:hypothetical protein